MHMERITTAAHPLYPAALALYSASFPAHEQRESPSQERILPDSDYHFTLLYDGEAFVGLALYWETDSFLYIEHLCILPEKRNQRYGERALALLREAGKPLILEIDPPIDEISRRREGFYRRCGFTSNPFPHVHPPYHRGNQGHPLVVLSCPGPLTAERYEAFARYLRERVMDRAFS